MSERACIVCGSIPYGGSVQGGGPLQWVHKPYCSKDCARVDYVVRELKQALFPLYDPRKYPNPPLDSVQEVQ
jgi:hypothetical protein